LRSGICPDGPGRVAVEEGHGGMTSATCAEQDRGEESAGDKQQSLEAPKIKCQATTYASANARKEEELSAMCSLTPAFR
jgi:hypothetical protein